MSATQVETRKITQAHGAQCETCGTVLGCQYWPLSNSVWMHRQGCPDHRIILWRWQRSA